MRVRLAVESDIPQLLPLMRGLAEFEQYIDKFAVTEEVLREQGFRRSPPDFWVLVAEEQQTILGIIVYYLVRFTASAKPEMLLKEVFVAPEARGRHVGEHLLRAAARRALALDVAAVQWQVATWNTEAMRFYERLGAVQDPTWVNYGLTLEACRKLVNDPNVLPKDLPAPEDDGGAAHLAGLRLPSIPLTGTDGTTVDLSAVRGRAVVFAYPRTGKPNEPPLVPDWDLIPGARGCTPQTCSFRDLAADFRAVDTSVFGLSTQEPEYQRELAERLHLPFPVLSDAQFALTRAVKLPTMDVGGLTLIKRLAWVQRDGVIEHVFYPVFPPDENAATVLAWLDHRT
jgi:peroxiredoxin/GNAT superfamily N-acetyltransferase